MNNLTKIYTLKVEAQNQLYEWLDKEVRPLPKKSDGSIDPYGHGLVEHHRGQGIGKILLKQAEEWAREKSIPLVRIRSNVKREDTRRFYLREGYELSKIANFFTKKI